MDPAFDQQGGCWIGPEATLMITLSEADVSLDLVVKDKQSALAKIAIKIARKAGLDERMLFRELVDRECFGSTGVGFGVAIPHVLLEMISLPVVSFARLAQPINFDGPDDDPVDLVYTVLWPQAAISDFLPALSQTCRLLRTSWIRESLRQARSAATYW